MIAPPPLVYRDKSGKPAGSPTVWARCMLTTPFPLRLTSSSMKGLCSLMKTMKALRGFLMYGRFSSTCSCTLFLFLQGHKHGTSLSFLDFLPTPEVEPGQWGHVAYCDKDIHRSVWIKTLTATGLTVKAQVVVIHQDQAESQRVC